MRIAVLLLLLVSTAVQAATFSVSNANDAGPGSLRQAILSANSALGEDHIQFADSLTPNNQSATLSLQSPLPEITEAVIFLDPYRLLIDGATLSTTATEPVNGLVLRAAGCSLDAIRISGFSGTGVHLLGGNNSIRSGDIRNCAVGVSVEGDGNDISSSSISGCERGMVLAGGSSSIKYNSFRRSFSTPDDPAGANSVCDLEILEREGNAVREVSRNWFGNVTAAIVIRRPELPGVPRTVTAIADNDFDGNAATAIVLHGALLVANSSLACEPMLGGTLFSGSFDGQPDTTYLVEFAQKPPGGYTYWSFDSIAEVVQTDAAGRATITFRHGDLSPLPPGAEYLCFAHPIASPESKVIVGSSSLLGAVPVLTGPAADIVLTRPFPFGYFTSSYVIGEVIPFVFEVVNTSAAQTSGQVRVSCALPPGLVYESGTAPGGEFAVNDKGSWRVDFNGIAPGQRIRGTVYLRGTVSAPLGEPIEPRFTAVTDVHDPVLTNNQDTLRYVTIRAASVSASFVTVQEAGDGVTPRTAEVTFTRSQPYFGVSEVTVEYLTRDDTAVAGEDYESRSGTITFSAAQSTVKVVIPIYSDSLAEGTETFHVRLRNASHPLQLEDGIVSIINGSFNPDASIAVMDRGSPGPELGAGIYSAAGDAQEVTGKANRHQMREFAVTVTNRGVATDSIRVSVLKYPSPYERLSDEFSIRLYHGGQDVTPPVDFGGIFAPYTVADLPPGASRTLSLRITPRSTVVGSEQIHCLVRCESIQQNLDGSYPADSVRAVLLVPKQKLQIRMERSGAQSFRAFLTGYGRGTVVPTQRLYKYNYFFGTQVSRSLYSEIGYVVFSSAGRQQKVRYTLKLTLPKSVTFGGDVLTPKNQSFPF